jgi:hypothetical protein
VLIAGILVNQALSPWALLLVRAIRSGIQLNMQQKN